MVVNDNASNQIPSGVVAFFASKLAPTESQNPRIPESQNPRIPESRNPGIPESRNPGITYI